MRKHLHHNFIGYEKMDGNSFIMAVEVIVDGYNSEEEALIRAKEILKRPFYSLRKVWECSTCAKLEEQVGMTRWLLAKIGKHLE